MKTHGISRPLRVKDSSVAAGILGNVSGFGEEIIVGRGKGLAGFEALVGGCCERPGEGFATSDSAVKKLRRRMKSVIKFDWISIYTCAVASS